MNILRWVGQGFGRKLGAILALLLLGWLGMGKAQAATIEEVWQTCNTTGTNLVNDLKAQGYQSPRTDCRADNYYIPGVALFWDVDGQGELNFYTRWPASSDCVAPETMDWLTGQCVDKEAECLAKNDGLSGDPVPRTWTSYCPANQCQMSMDNPTCTTVAGVSGSICRGVIRYTGATCGTPTPPGTDSKNDPEADRNEECKPVEGQTMCVKANGDHCASASTGRQICWGQGETGTKTDGDAIQTRAPGTDPPPTPTPPPGETLNPPRPPITTTTTRPTGTPIVTTTQTTTTGNGTNGGPKDQGEPTGSGSDDGEDDGEENGVEGGDDCESPYVTKGDALLGSILKEAWQERCAREGDKEGRGDDAEGLQGQADAMDPGDDASGLFSSAGNGGGLNEAFISLGGGACPDFPEITIPGTDYTFTTPPEFCTIGQALAALFTLLAYIYAMKIVME